MCIVIVCVCPFLSARREGEISCRYNVMLSSISDCYMFDVVCEFILLILGLGELLIVICLLFVDSYCLC